MIWNNNSVWIWKITVNKTGDYENSNKSKIFREISALKFQEQHAAQFRYDGHTLQLKQKSTAGVFCKILK